MMNKIKFIEFYAAIGAAFLIVILLAGGAYAAPYAYITNSFDNNVSVIDTATDTVIASVDVGIYPEGVAVNPAGTKVYVTNHNTNNISVIDTSNNTVTEA